MKTCDPLAQPIENMGDAGEDETEAWLIFGIGGLPPPIFGRSSEEKSRVDMIGLGGCMMMYRINNKW